MQKADNCTRKVDVSSQTTDPSVSLYAIITRLFNSFTNMEVTYSTLQQVNNRIVEIEQQLAILKNLAHGVGQYAFPQDIGKTEQIAGLQTELNELYELKARMQQLEI